MSLVLGSSKMNRPLNPPSRILRVYVGLDWAQSHTIWMVTAPPYFLKAVSLKMGPTVGTVGRMYI